MMSQLTKQEENSNTFLGETLGSTVLDSVASGTVCGTKWYECFLETLTNVQRKKKIVKGVRTLKISDGNKLNSLYKITLPRVIVDIEVSIVTYDIPLWYSTSLEQRLQERAGTCLNFENDSVMMFKKNSIKMDIVASLSPNLYWTKVNSNILFIKVISNKSEKI